MSEQVVVGIERLRHDGTFTIKILINARAFIRTITFHKEGGGHLLEATTCWSRQITLGKPALFDNNMY